MEPVANPPKRPLGTEIAEEHRRLTRAIRAVEETLDQHPNAAWLRDLLPRIERLSDTAEAHFHSEGSSELYRELPEESPRFAKRLEELENEHDAILDLARAAVDLARSLSADAEIYELRELDARVQWLLAFLRRHEAEETEIVMRAYWEEVGSGD